MTEFNQKTEYWDVEAVPLEKILKIESQGASYIRGQIQIRSFGFLFIRSFGQKIRAFGFLFIRSSGFGLPYQLIIELAGW